MSQWMQCTAQWAQITPTWADSVCNIHPDTHDGFDEEIHRKVRESVAKDERHFKDKRKRLRDAIRAVADPEGFRTQQEEETRASLHAMRLESGAYDLEAIERNEILQAKLLAIAKRIEEDEDDVVILALWS